MRSYILKIMLTLAVFFSSHSYSTDSEKPLLDFMALMEGAPEVSVTFKVQTTIQSEYKIKSIQPYLYLDQTHDLVELPNISHVTSNMLKMQFQSPPSSGEYLVLHVQYTPRFVIDGKSEAVCIAKFYTKKIFENFRCDSQTTSLFLLASAVEDPTQSKPLIHADVVKRMIQFSALPNTQSWENYQGIITLLLNHVAEQPNYSVINQPGQYLHQFRELTAKINDHVLNKRQFDIEELDALLLEQDHTMTNISYRIYMVLDSMIARLKTSLPHVSNRPIFMREFFSGLNPFTLLEPESQKLANIEVGSQDVQFVMWPWFEKVSVQFDEQEPFYVHSQQIDVPHKIRKLVLRPFGKKGRFPKQVIALKQVIHTTSETDPKTEVGND